MWLRPGVVASTEDELRELRKQAENARQQQARAQAERDTAQRQLDEAVAALKNEFGITTPAEATAMVQKLEAQLAAEMEHVRRQLLAIKPD